MFAIRGAGYTRADVEEIPLVALPPDRYSVEDFDQRVADVSVDHPEIVEDYREGHRLAQAGANGDGSTEDLRQAMRRYRSLFDELVGPSTDQGEDAVPAGARSAR